MSRTRFAACSRVIAVAHMTSAGPQMRQFSPVALQSEQYACAHSSTLWVTPRALSSSPCRRHTSHATVGSGWRCAHLAHDTPESEDKLGIAQTSLSTVLLPSRTGCYHARTVGVKDLRSAGLITPRANGFRRAGQRRHGLLVWVAVS